VAAAAFVPFGDVHGRHDVYIEGYEPGAEEFMTPLRNMVDESYFDTLGVRVVAGRGFTEQDREDSRPVAIINETMAGRYWVGRNAIGGRIQADLGVERQVVGIVADGKYTSRLEEAQPYLYIPLSQSEYQEGMSFVLATGGDPEELIEPIRQLSRQLAPELPDPGIATLDQNLDRSLGVGKGSAVLVSTFGLLALILAMVGVYGVMSYVVSQRTHEYAVRMAVGAERSEIVKLVLRRGMRTTLVGIGIGLGLAFVASGVLTRFLYEVSALDPSILLAVSLGLGAIALLACYVPALLASRVDPVVILRAE
jgi:putative ABC transport system permease protein